MFELIDSIPSNAVIKVIGVGGGGGNAVKHKNENNVEGVDLICDNFYFNDTATTEVYTE